MHRLYSSQNTCRQAALSNSWRKLRRTTRPWTWRSVLECLVSLSSGGETGYCSPITIQIHISSRIRDYVTGQAGGSAAQTYILFPQWCGLKAGFIQHLIISFSLLCLHLLFMLWHYRIKLSVFKIAVCAVWPFFLVISESEGEIMYCGAFQCSINVLCGVCRGFMFCYTVS